MSDAVMGRPRVLDAERKQQVCELLAIGVPLYIAAKSAGCCEATLRRERARDPEFEQNVCSATVEVEVRSLRCIATAAEKDWHAARWLLERTRPEGYAAGARRTAADSGNSHAERVRVLEAVFDVLRDRLSEQELMDVTIQLSRALEGEQPAAAAPARSTIATSAATATAADKATPIRTEYRPALSPLSPISRPKPTLSPLSPPAERSPLASALAAEPASSLAGSAAEGNRTERRARARQAKKLARQLRRRPR